MTQRLSTWCALRCREALFQRFLGVTSEAGAVAEVYRRCGISSRSELDRNLAAAERFHDKIRHPYNEFYHAQEESHV